MSNESKSKLAIIYTSYDIRSFFALFYDINKNPIRFHRMQLSVKGKQPVKFGEDMKSLC